MREGEKGFCAEAHALLPIHNHTRLPENNLEKEQEREEEGKHPAPFLLSPFFFLRSLGLGQDRSREEKPAGFFLDPLLAALREVFIEDKWARPKRKHKQPRFPASPSFPPGHCPCEGGETRERRAACRSSSLHHIGATMTPSCRTA